MNYIVYDLELNSKIFKSRIPNEIIEIGAVKLNDNLEILDSFQSFVRPKVHRKLFPLIKRKTGIIQEDVNNADSFKEVITRFIQWISGEYVLCSWGHDDIHHLRTNCELNRIKIGWLNSNIDIQNQVSQIYQLPKGEKYSLKKALLILDIPLEESLHRADVDAKYTAKIFIDVFDKLDFSTYNPIKTKKHTVRHKVAK